MERGAGPNPDDWAGLPFNESGRAKALSFSQSIISMPERICWFQTQWHIAAGPFSLKIWSENDPLTGKIIAWVHWRVGNSRAHDHLDGRASASLEKCSARSDRLHHRHLEWRRADRIHHAHQDRVYAPQWRGEQRPGHHYHHVFPSRRYADAGVGDGGSRLFDRAVYSDAVLYVHCPRPSPSRARPASSAMKAWRRAGFRIIFRGRILSSMRWTRSTTFPGKPRWAERKQCIRPSATRSRISS